MTEQSTRAKIDEAIRLCVDRLGAAMAGSMSERASATLTSGQAAWVEEFAKTVADDLYDAFQREYNAMLISMLAEMIQAHPVESREAIEKFFVGKRS